MRLSQSALSEPFGWLALHQQRLRSDEPELFATGLCDELNESVAFRRHRAWKAPPTKRKGPSLRGQSWSALDPLRSFPFSQECSERRFSIRRVAPTAERCVMRRRMGGCNCGQVRFEASGEPVRVGLCHCKVCRKETGSLGNFFAVWRADCVSVTGGTRSWMLSTDNRPTCGSSVFAMVDSANEVEVRVGAFDDAPTDLTPTYELWVPRRERWLVPIAAAEQHEGNRT